MNNCALFQEPDYMPFRSSLMSLHFSLIEINPFCSCVQIAYVQRKLPLQQ